MEIYVPVMVQSNIAQRHYHMRYYHKKLNNVY